MIKYINNDFINGDAVNSKIQWIKLLLFLLTFHIVIAPISTGHSF
jgi:hypothetical protein